jgi:hypothetical protein
MGPEHPPSRANAPSSVADQIAALKAEVAALVHDIATANGPTMASAAEEPALGTPTTTGSDATVGAEARETHENLTVLDSSSSDSSAPSTVTSGETGWVQFTDGEVQISLNGAALAGSDIVSGVEGTSPPEAPVGKPPPLTTELATTADLNLNDQPTGTANEAAAQTGSAVASLDDTVTTEDSDTLSTAAEGAKTLFMEELRRYYASISTVPPPDHSLLIIADICTAQGNITWLDSMLEERHGKSLTTFRHQQRSSQQAMRSILGLSVPVMQEFDTPTPTATPSSIVSTPEGTTAVTPTIVSPTATPASAMLPVSTPKVEPEPASTFIQNSVYIECSVCAQGKPTGQFTAKQRKRGANDRRCKQCQVDTGGADPFGGVVRAALAEQATKFQTALREQGEAHATQLQALQQFTSKAAAAPRQQQLRGFDAPKFPGLAAVRLNPLIFQSFEDRLVDSVSDATDRAPHSTLTKSARLGLDDAITAEIKQQIALERVLDPTVPLCRDLNFDQLLRCLNRVCFPDELREAFKNQLRQIRIRKNETVSAFHTRLEKQVSEAYPPGTPQLPASDMLHVYLQAIQPAHAMYDFVLQKALDDDDAVALHDRPDAVLHAQRWALKFAKQARITQSLGKAKSTGTTTVSVHAGWDAEFATDTAADSDDQTEFKTVTCGRVRHGVSHITDGVSHLIPGACAEAKGRERHRHSWDRQHPKFTGKDCTFCLKHSKKQTTVHNMSACPCVSPTSKTACWWCCGPHAVKDCPLPSMPTKHAADTKWFK